MKKNLLCLAYCFASIISVQAQTLYGLTTNGGNDGVGTLIKFVPGTNNLTVSKSFENSVSGPFHTKFIQASDGKLYGVTQYGGNDSSGVGGLGDGVIFSFDPSTSTYTKLKKFDGTDGRNPSGSLVQASDGKLYGMTEVGGSNDHGVIFSFNPSISTYTKLHDFDGMNGASPRGSLIQASDGKLYGMAGGGGSSYYGVIFSFDPSTSTYTKLKDFDGTNGYNPYGSLVQASNGKLYGMNSAGGSSGRGVIFSFDPSSSTFTKLKDFDGTNGAKPFGSLVQASNGKLYGMASAGGSGDFGVIFSFDPSTSGYTKLKDFDSTNGSSPWGELMQASDGKLYGMTLTGGIIDNSEGADGNGVIFSFDPSTSAYTKLKDFDCTGGFPYGSLLQASDGKVYGMASHSIFIFSFDPITSTFTKLKDFAETDDGVAPVGSLVQASDGKLYGMTNDGGSNNLGLIFSFDPSSSTYTKLKNFSLACDPFSNGSNPTGSLIQASNGKLYAMTAAGGNNDRGVIFSFDPSTSTYTKLMDFSFTNGASPTGSLLQASDGKLYGMTNEGGSIGNGGSINGNGVIFSYDPSTSTYTKLKDFDNTNGGNPWGSLIQARDGKLYGMTSGGGSYGPNNSGGMGVIFSYDPSTSTYTKLRDFDFTNGAWPEGSLMQASDGKLYGMTSGGGSNGTSNDNGYGVIFSFDPSTSTYTKLKDFDGTNGLNPQGNLIQASDGKIYGMTYSGGSYSGGDFGPYGFGVIFSFDPSTSTYTKLKDFDWANGALPLYGSAFIEVKSGAFALPVTLISFTGKNIGNNNQLTWKVESEFDLNFYELQRGFDGKNFTGIGQIKATGKNSYTYDDPISNKVSSTYYYRLKIVDKNGSFTYSSICSIIFKATNTNISISPNPVTKSVRIQTSTGDPLTGNSATATIRIYSSAMQLLQSKKISATDGNAISIPVEKLASGIYYLQLVNGRETSVLKFVKE